MSMPKAYDPIQGQKYQILTRYNKSNDRAWEHCDYAKDTAEKNYLLKEYRLSYGSDFSFKTILLPMKYWKAENEK